MATEEERRQELVTFLANYMRSNWSIETGYLKPVWTLAYEGTVEFFEQTNQKPLADAIRFGVRAVESCDGWYTDLATGKAAYSEDTAFMIDRPETQQCFT